MSTLHSEYALAPLLDPRYTGRLFAPDKLEAIKQSAIDEARFEPSRQIRPPTHLSRHKRRRQGMRWPVGRARRHTGCASAHLICISRVTGGC